MTFPWGPPGVAWRRSRCFIRQCYVVKAEKGKGLELQEKKERKKGSKGKGAGRGGAKTTEVGEPEKKTKTKKQITCCLLRFRLLRFLRRLLRFLRTTRESPSRPPWTSRLFLPARAARGGARRSGEPFPAKWRRRRSRKLRQRQQRRRRQRAPRRRAPTHPRRRLRPPARTGASP